jgi:hypothetical protein
MVDNLIVITIESGAKPPLGDRESDGIGKSLTQRARGDFDARRAAMFRMTRRTALRLAEVPEVFHRQVITGQEQQAVEQCTRMPSREHETISVGPVRISRIVPQMTGPQNVGHCCCAQRHAWVSGVRLLDHVDRQHPDGVDTETLQIVSCGAGQLCRDR